MRFDVNLPNRLQRGMSRGLPGKAAQEPLAPKHCAGQHFMPAPTDAKQAAVVMMLYPHGNQWHMPLTVRAAHLRHHAGQVGLPGGRVEANESLEQAALRELQEELAVPPNDVTVIGRLSSIYLYVSNFQVHPIVAWCERRIDMVPDPSEVAELIEVPISSLLARENFRQAEVEAVVGNQPRPVEKERVKVPAIWIDEYKVWGATAIMLAEFIAVLDQAKTA